MRKKIIIGNWKMNLTPSEAKDLLTKVKDKLNTEDVDVAFCPSPTVIPTVREELENTKIGLGAQNMYFEDEGAYTGETSPKMLKELDVKYVILGHSERREYFNETDEIINTKVLKAIEYEFTPILCVGENLIQREDDVTLEFITNQIEIALRGVSKEKVKDMIIAYEPLWAIGTGETATKEQAEEVCSEIRKVIYRLYDEETSEKLRIQYGGSVKPKNVKEILSMPNIDGALVGGASLKVDFIDVVNYNS